MEKVDLNVIGKKLEEGFEEAKVDKYHNCATWAMAGQKNIKTIGNSCIYLHRRFIIQRYN